MLPEIAGSTGYVLKHRDKDELVALVQRALREDNESLGAKARRRIADNYSIARRRQALIDVIG